MDTHFKETSDLVQQLYFVAEKLTDSKQNELANKILEVSRKIIGRTISGSIPSSNILIDIVNLLNDCNIKFAVIGGIAVNAHGQNRSTEDIDFLVTSFPPNLKLNNSEYMGKFNFYKTKSSTGTHLIIDHKSGTGYVKLLLANDQLRKEAINNIKNIYILGVNVPVVSPEFLVALKLKAITFNPKRKMKDVADITSILIKLKNSFDITLINKYLIEEELKLLQNLINV